ncbi:MAG: hypothetical protein NTV86_07975 [Planctomycetota bacterium]|nr:hypothetical protein [Planctomycetota bacterium]
MEHEDDPNLTAHVLGELSEAERPALEARLADEACRQALDRTGRTCRLIEQALANEPGGWLGEQRRERLRRAVEAPHGRRAAWVRGMAAAAAVLLVAATGLLAFRLDQVCRQRDDYAARLVNDSQQHLRDSRALDDQLLAATKRVVELQSNRDAIQEKLLTLRKSVAELRAIYGNARQVPADLAFYKAMSDSANFLVSANNEDQLDQAADNTLLALTALETNKRSYPPEQLRQRLGEANGRIDVINNVKRAAQNQRDYANNLALGRNAAFQDQVSNTIATNPKGGPAPAGALSPLAVYAQDLIVQQKYDKAIEVLQKALTEKAALQGKEQGAGK